MCHIIMYYFMICYYYLLISSTFVLIPGIISFHMIKKININVKKHFYHLKEHYQIF